MALQRTDSLFTVVEASSASKVPFSKGQYIIQTDGTVYYDPTTATTIDERVKLTPDVGGNVTVLEITDSTEDSASLDTIANPIKGDMAICKHLLTDDKYSFTAYVYSGTVWVAMDGNVSAENVILTSDITMAGNYTAVGNLTKSQNGTGTFSTRGKTVADAFREIFTKTLQPTITAQPSVSLSAPKNSAYEVGTEVTPTYSASLNAGSYTYGPATGITAKSWEVTNNVTSESFTTASGTFASVTVTDSTNFKITAKATYDAGAIAKNNVGGTSDPVVQIAAGSKSATSGAITGYRKPFWGYKSTALDTSALTSADIRSLGSSGNSAGGVPSSLTVPVGSIQVIFAVKAGVKNSLSVKDANALNAPVAFTKIANAVQVKGCSDSSTAVDYDIWVATYDAAIQKAQNLQLSWS